MIDFIDQVRRCLAPRALAAAAALAFLLGAAAALADPCPAGSYPSVDSWGTQTCEQFDTPRGITAATVPDATCPAGSAPAVDAAGNQACHGSGAAHGISDNDAMQRCPVGTLAALDREGNRECHQI